MLQPDSHSSIQTPPVRHDGPAPNVMVNVRPQLPAFGPPAGQPHAESPLAPASTSPVLSPVSRLVTPHREPSPNNAVPALPPGSMSQSEAGLQPMQPGSPRAQALAGHGNNNEAARADYVALDMPPLENAPSRRQQIGNLAPFVDGAAAVASGATVAASVFAPPAVASTFGAISGFLWGSSAGMAEAGNTEPYSHLARAANALNFGAGMASAGAALTSGTDQTNLGYLSSAAWGVSAIFNMANAATNRTRSRLSRGLQAASGVMNVAAAGFSAAAVQASSEEDTTNAAGYGAASSVLWATGSLLAYGAVRTASNAPMPAVASEATPLRRPERHSFGSIQPA